MGNIYYITKDGENDINNKENLYLSSNNAKTFYIMSSIHPIFLTSPIAFLLLLFIVSLFPTYFLSRTNILSSSRYLFSQLFIFFAIFCYI